MRISTALSFLLMLSVRVPAAAAVVAEPDIVYLNGCTGGCSVQPGTDDAVNGKSSLINTSATLAAFGFSAATFAATAACVRHVLAPYNVAVRISSPGALARREIMLTASSAQTLGYSSNLPALSPFDGHPHNNVIAFVFAPPIGDSVDGQCFWTSQVIGNLYGLDIVTSCTDIMSYGTGCGVKSFTDADAPCAGAGSSGTCVLGNTTQNSAATLRIAPGPTDILFANGVENFEQPASGPSP